MRSEFDQVHFLYRRQHASKAERLGRDLMDSCHFFLGLSQMLMNHVRIIFLICEMDEIADCVKRITDFVHDFECELSGKSSSFGLSHGFGSNVEL